MQGHKSALALAFSLLCLFKNDGLTGNEDQR